MGASKICLLAAFLVVSFQITHAQSATDFNSWDCPRQCHGDADCGQGGPVDPPVNDNDLAIIQAVYNYPGGDWPAYYPGSINYDARADFDRNFIVNTADFNIIQEFIYKLPAQVPADCSKKLELESMTGDCLVPDSNYTINWDWRIFTAYPEGQDHPGTLILYYSTDYGENWVVIDTVSSVTSYEWLVPSAISDQCLLRIDDINHPGLTDTKIWVLPCTGPLDSDFNDDCYVDFFDFAILATGWLEEGGTDMNDLSIMTSTWLDCNNPCDPSCGE